MCNVDGGINPIEYFKCNIISINKTFSNLSHNLSDGMEVINVLNLLDTYDDVTMTSGKALNFFPVMKGKH